MTGSNERRSTTVLFALFMAAFVLAVVGWFLFTTFICGKIEDWPYYTADMDGADIRTDSPRPRGGQGDTAVYPLGTGAGLSVRTDCYPRYEKTGQTCRIRVAFQSGGEVVEPVSMAISARGADGGELIDFAFYRTPSGRIQMDLPGAILLKGSDLPREFDLFLPDLRVNGTAVHIPTVHFTLVENRECVPLMTNS